MQPIIIGVAGGTASGKTTVSDAILERVGRDRMAYIEHDSYYRDLSHTYPSRNDADRTLTILTPWRLGCW